MPPPFLRCHRTVRAAALLALAAPLPAQQPARLYNFSNHTAWVSRVGGTTVMKFPVRTVAQFLPTSNSQAGARYTFQITCMEGSQEITSSLVARIEQGADGRLKAVLEAVPAAGRQVCLRPVVAGAAGKAWAYFGNEASWAPIEVPELVPVAAAPAKASGGEQDEQEGAAYALALSTLAAIPRGSAGAPGAVPEAGTEDDNLVAAAYALAMRTVADTRAGAGAPAHDRASRVETKEPAAEPVESKAIQSGAGAAPMPASLPPITKLPPGIPVAFCLPLD